MTQACREERWHGSQYPPKIKREPKKKERKARAKESEMTRVRGRILFRPAEAIEGLRQHIHKQW
jgi:hypothetical protein